MLRFLLAAALACLVTGCAPPRWTEPLCRGQPDVWKLNEQDLATQVDRLNNEKLLDLAACNMATSHPSVLGFPDHFITSRSSSMAALLLNRIEARDEGLISMGYMGLLEEMAAQNPDVLSSEQRKSALHKCLEIYPPFTDRRGQVHHSCPAFGGP